MAFEDFMDGTFGKMKWLSPPYAAYRAGKGIYDYATDDTPSAGNNVGKGGTGSDESWLDTYNNSYAKYFTPGIGPMHALYDAGQYVGNNIFDWLGGDDAEPTGGDNINDLGSAPSQEPQRTLDWYRKNLDFEDISNQFFVS